MPRLDDTYVTDLRAVYARPRFNATINTTPNVAGRVTAEPSRESTYRTECRLTTRGLSRPRRLKPPPDPFTITRRWARVSGKGRRGCSRNNSSPEARARMGLDLDSTGCWMLLP